jgi:hypothetical protein
MAKLRDQMEAIAKDRAGKAEIAVPVSVKELEIRMNGIRELRDSQGRVYKVVGILECRAVVAGRAEPIEERVELSAGTGWGVPGELASCFKPAIDAFLDRAGALYVGMLKKEETPLGDAPPPLPSMMAEPSPSMMARVKKANAASQQQRKPSTPPPDQFAESEEVNVENGGEA